MNRDLVDKSKKIDDKRDEPETKEGFASEKDGEDAPEITPEEVSRKIS
jgi:hypothetical protein